MRLWPAPQTVGPLCIVSHKLPIVCCSFYHAQDHDYVQRILYRPNRTFAKTASLSSTRAQCFTRSQRSHEFFVFLLRCAVTHSVDLPTHHTFTHSLHQSTPFFPPFHTFAKTDLLSSTWAPCAIRSHTFLVLFLLGCDLLTHTLVSCSAFRTTSSPSFPLPFLAPFLSHLLSCSVQTCIPACLPADWAITYKSY